jgi:hypothetical protein
MKSAVLLAAGVLTLTLSAGARADQALVLQKGLAVLQGPAEDVAARPELAGFLIHAVVFYRFTKPPRRKLWLLVDKRTS